MQGIRPAWHTSARRFNHGLPVIKAREKGQTQTHIQPLLPKQLPAAVNITAASCAVPMAKSLSKLAAIPAAEIDSCGCSSCCCRLAAASRCQPCRRYGNTLVTFCCHHCCRKAEAAVVSVSCCLLAAACCMLKVGTTNGRQHNSLIVSACTHVAYCCCWSMIAYYCCWIIIAGQPCL